MFTLKAESKGLELKCGQSLYLPSLIQTDPLKLRQILINLPNNAIKFTNKGSVSLTVTCPETVPIPVTFTVQDTGPGIAPGELAKLFQAAISKHCPIDNPSLYRTLKAYLDNFEYRQVFNTLEQFIN